MRSEQMRDMTLLGGGVVAWPVRARAQKGNFRTIGFFRRSETSGRQPLVRAASR
jgi:hypothetical protein